MTHSAPAAYANEWRLFLMTATPTAAAQDTSSAGLLAAFSDQLAQAVERTGNSVVRVEARRRYPASEQAPRPDSRR